MIDKKYILMQRGNGFIRSLLLYAEKTSRGWLAVFFVVLVKNLKSVQKMCLNNGKMIEI